MQPYLEFFKCLHGKTNIALDSFEAVLEEESGSPLDTAGLRRLAVTLGASAEKPRDAVTM